MKVYYVLSVLLLAQMIGHSSSWGMGGSHEKIKLDDVKTITLYKGAWTTSRRSAAVPQLECIGGSARCTFLPDVVQCYNRGSDGYDAQWECKADMDTAYRFGKLTVSCEGFDYPNDPYILAGSCGYKLELTKDGEYSPNHEYYRGSAKSADHGWNRVIGYSKLADFSKNIAFLVSVFAIGYVIYRTCISPYHHNRQRSTTNDDYHGRGPGNAPPPPGFRTDYYPRNDDTSFGGSDSCNANRRSTNTGTGTGDSWARNYGGFWTGAATGGLLGYMFGNRNNTHDQTYYRRNTGGSSTWGGSGQRSSNWGESSSSGFSSGSSSSGSRTASGFGGTSRR